MSAWLEERLATGRAMFDAMVDVAAIDPGDLWDALLPDGRFSDADIAQALSAGITAGVHRERFVPIVRKLRPTTGDLPVDVVMLPPLRRLLWAVAVGLSNLGAIERRLGLDDGWAER